MGKKDKDKKKKKGKGAEKTAAKTEKKLNLKLKKELAAKGEDDIESIIKAIEDEERKRSEVKEIRVEPPSHRSNFSLTAHNENPELIMFGGEFFNGKTTVLNNDLLIYNVKRKEWTQIKSPGAPPPRCAHQAAFSGGGGQGSSGGQLWIFGGEYASPSETQFYHYKDLWVFHFASKRWQKINVSGGPSSRSGHRMVLLKRHLVVFGGFHDNNFDCKYFNDVYAFDLDNYKWKKLETTGPIPSPRSGHVMFPTPDGRIVVFGGYFKEKKASVSGKKDTGNSENGKTLSDMFILSPDKHDETMTKWRWQNVKQVGAKPSLRSGMSVAVTPGSGKSFLFGGVQDEDADDEDLKGHFFNDLYSLHVENERATWQLIQLSGKRDQEKKRRRRKNSGAAGDDDNDDDGDEKDSEKLLDELKISDCSSNTVVVEDGAFTITSTVGTSSTSTTDVVDKDESPTKPFFIPSPRFGAGLVAKSGHLFLFGGLVEDEEDRQLTLRDFYSLDIHKLDEWEVLIESDVNTMEWFDSEEEEEESDDDSEEDESDSEEEEDEMDTD